MNTLIGRIDNLIILAKELNKLKVALRVLTRSGAIDSLSETSKIKLEERIQKIEFEMESVGRLSKRVFDNL